MKNIKGTLYSKYAFIFAAIFMLCYMILGCMKSSYLYLYLFKITSDEIMPFLLFIISALLVSGGAVCGYKFIKYKKVIIVITVIISMVIIFLFYIYISLLSDFDYKYFNLYSEDKAHHIVVKESALLFSGKCELYEVTAPGIMRYVGICYTDDGYRPFSDNKFSFEWNKDSFVLNYYHGGDGDRENGGFKSEKFPYAK